MVDMRELHELRAKVAKHGGTMQLHTDRNDVHTVTVSGLKGIGPLPMPPIQASERVREWLASSAKG